jgi:hypothetical protein
MIGTTRIGGLRRRAERSPEAVRHAGLASAQIAHLTRLENDLQRACARYEQAITALDEESTELERRARTDAIIDAAMTAPPERECDEPIHLTHVTFDDLRSVGLSVTQAKRVVALRDEGVLASTDNLDEVPGLPKVVVTELRHRLTD